MSLETRIFYDKWYRRAFYGTSALAIIAMSIRLMGAVVWSYPLMVYLLNRGLKKKEQGRRVKS